MTELIEYMKKSVMNTDGDEQDKCMRILKILERKAQIKNFILSIITIISANVFLWSVITRNAGNIQTYTALISGSWLVLFAIANRNTDKA